MASFVMKDFAAGKSSLAAVGVLQPKSRRIRLNVIVILSLVWTGALVARLYSLQLSDFERWQDWALKQHFAEVKLASERGPILDRDDKLLAISVPADSIYVRPGQVKDKESTAKKVAKILKIDPKVVQAKLTEKKPFVWIQRQVPRAVGSQVVALKIPGVGTVLESKRMYPFNQAASSLIGKVGVDGSGLSGIEAVYERELHAQQVKTLATRDALGNMIQEASTDGEFRLPKGKPLKLTIDTGLQQIVDQELETGRKEANALAAVAIMVDSNTGEILAMSQAPAVNFNTATNVSKDSLKNLTIETVFEPGSIMKPIVAAAALDAKVIRAKDIIDCEHGRFSFARHVIKDVHPSDSISFFDVVVRSSNIGMTKVGMRMGSEKLYTALRAFGFGQHTGLGLPGESGGILRPVSSWAQVDVATHSFGQGIAVTPLQMVRATAAIANGGMLPTLHIVDDPNAVFESRRVVSADSARKVQEMLYGVVEDEHGTGGKAAIEGVRIGGKTGTAQKARTDGRGYAAGSYVASFVGFADASAIGIQKNITLMVVIDEPHTKSIYGGTLSAPVFQRIMQRSLHLISTRDQLLSPSGTNKEDLLQTKGGEALPKRPTGQVALSIESEEGGISPGAWLTAPVS